MALDETLREELLALAADDRKVRAELVADGTLFGGYHPRLEAVHQHNARRLDEIIDVHGWPVASTVGDDGAEAAWLILQHAIGNPPLQRKGLRLLKEAAAR